MNHRAFPMVSLPPQRSTEKPRTKGLTMVVDWGLPLARQTDLMHMSGDFLDLAKLAVGSVRVYREDRLLEKIRVYKDHGVRSFIGGGIVERLYMLDGPDALGPFFKEARRVGVDIVEISDNYMPLSKDERCWQIELAIKSGLQVFGEVGSKHEKNAAESLIDQARDCLNAGAVLLIVEGAELVDEGQIKTGMVQSLKASLDPDLMMIELIGPWITGVTQSQVHELKRLLISEFGPDVSLGNVMVDDLFETEMARLAIGVAQPIQRAW